nr:hypothetical protein [Cronobacter dublinensis]
MSITSSVANGAVIVTESTRVEYRAAVKARKKEGERAAYGEVLSGHDKTLIAHIRPGSAGV